MPGSSLKYSRRAAVRRPSLFFFFAGQAFADNSKISPDLQPLLANPSNKINVIVQYNYAAAAILRRAVGRPAGRSGEPARRRAEHGIFADSGRIGDAASGRYIGSVESVQRELHLARPAVGRFARLYRCRRQRAVGLEFRSGWERHRHRGDRQRNLQSPGFERGQLDEEPRGVPAELHRRRCSTTISATALMWPASSRATAVLPINRAPSAPSKASRRTRIFWICGFWIRTAPATIAW